MTRALVMAPDAATWVQSTVWTKAMRAGMGPLECACQWGMTGWCSMGNHKRCHRAAPDPRPETYVVNAQAEVLGWPGGRHAEVWLRGPACRWSCPCECHRTPPLEAEQQFVLF